MNGWTISRLGEWPSQQEFSSQIEVRNLPVVFEGCVKVWPAFVKWKPSDGGLDYLKSIAGNALVQVMVSESGGNFYGDIRSHERESISFARFLDLANEVCRDRSSSKEAGQCVENKPVIDENRDYSREFIEIENTRKLALEEDSLNHLPAESQLYLAQAPLYNKEHRESCSLAALMQDILVPDALEVQLVTNINLWMSASESRSSTHYDPYHNFLCVVAGCKRVTLFPPSATPYLYPFPIYGEASNHSAVDFVKPDLQKHPCFKDASDCCQVAVLNAGDALFIPEGCYHQVDNSSLTLAINFWWPSLISSALNTHMDAYYLRRIVSSLLDHEKEQILKTVVPHSIVGDTYVGHGTCNMDKLPLKEGGFPFSEMVKDSTVEDTLKISGFGVVDDNDTYVGHGTFNIEKLPLKENGFPFHEMVKESTVEDTQKISSFEVVDDTGHSVLQSSKDGLERRNAVEQLNYMERQCLRCLVLNIPESAMLLGKNLPVDTEGEPGEMVGIKVSSDLEDIKLADHIYEIKSSSRKTMGSSDGVQDRELVAHIFLLLEPMAVQRLLLVMVEHFPRSLEALILHCLSPVAAESLTRKFDEIDKLNSDSQQKEFYKAFYSIFEDPQKVMASLLDGKEEFAAMALCRTMKRYLGLSCSPVQYIP